MQKKMLLTTSLVMIVLTFLLASTKISVKKQVQQTNQPKETTTSQKGWKEYKFEKAGLSFSAPEDMTVTGELIDEKTFTLYVQRSSYPNPTYYQLYGLLNISETSDKDIEAVKTDLDLNTIIERQIGGYKAVQGQYKTERNRLVTFIFTPKGLFTLATSQPTKENSSITDSILNTFILNL